MLLIVTHFGVFHLYASDNKEEMMNEMEGKHQAKIEEMQCIVKNAEKAVNRLENEQLSRDNKLQRANEEICCLRKTMDIMRDRLRKADHERDFCLDKFSDILNQNSLEGIADENYRKMFHTCSSGVTR